MLVISVRSLKQAQPKRGVFGRYELFGNQVGLTATMSSPDRLASAPAMSEARDLGGPLRAAACLEPLHAGGPQRRWRHCTGLRQQICTGRRQRAGAFLSLHAADCLEPLHSGGPQRQRPRYTGPRQRVCPVLEWRLLTRAHAKETPDNQGQYIKSIKSFLQDLSPIRPANRPG